MGNANSQETYVNKKFNEKLCKYGISVNKFRTPTINDDYFYCTPPCDRELKTTLQGFLYCPNQFYKPNVSTNYKHNPKLFLYTDPESKIFTDKSSVPKAYDPYNF